MVKIRESKVTQEDYEIFMNMHKTFAYSEPCPELKSIRPPVIKNKVEYEDFITQKGDIVFAIDDSENVVGYAILQWFEDMACKIQEIYIVEQYQGKHLGKQFVNTIKQVAKEGGFLTIELMSYSMATDNFWSACNFRYTGANDKYEFQIR